MANKVDVMIISTGLFSYKVVDTRSIFHRDQGTYSGFGALGKARVRLTVTLASIAGLMIQGENVSP